MRVAMVTLGSALATVAVIANAFYQKKQFYPSVVYLTKSNPSIAVLYAQVFVLIFLFGKALRKIFFGQLRASEIEHLIEKFWYVITETCLAFTVFRDDFSPKFVALFTFLLFMKAFHWLIEDRVDYMERSPVITFVFHLRVISLLALLGTVDSILIHHAFRTTIASGASVQMVFGFEYSILLVMVVAVIMKYILHSIDYMTEHPWDNKNVYLLYAELITGFVKCCLFISFVGVMVKIHTFPLFAVRPMYLTIRAFKKSLSDVVLSRRAITYMNTRFADATADELQRLDNTCIICREQMSEGKKLPCNHIFHTHCLRSWFQRQQSCPTCRMDVLSVRAQQTTPPQPPPQPRPPQPHLQQMPLHAAAFMGMRPPGSPFGVSMPPPMAPNGTSPGQETNTAATSTTTTSSATSVPTASPQSTFTFPTSTNPFAMGSPAVNLYGMGFPPPFSLFTAPPPFMNMPPPPPVFAPPNIDLSTLSEEELKNLEGQERANVEARVRLLRNVHSLLDKVIIQLNQYSQAISTINSMSGAESSRTHEPSSSKTTENSVSRASFDVFDDHGPTPDPAAEGEIVANIRSLNENEESDCKDTQSKEHPFLICDASAENELRRRRLERFQSVNKENKQEE